MRTLVAVDVDRTLLRVDSFRKALWARLDAPLALLAALRSARLLSRAGFARRVTQQLEPFWNDAAAVERFVDGLFTQIDPAVLELAHRSAGDRGQIVLVSASPERYVARLADRLGATAIGSRFVDGEFVHCYGERKRRDVEARFPREEFDYALAIADHPSDAPLLAAFRESVWWKR